jgi:membrane protease YdiL (CAAX protease family)
LSEPQPAAPPDPFPITAVNGLTPGQKRLIAGAEVLLCSSVPTQIVIGGLLWAAGWSPTTEPDQFSLPFVFALSLIDTAVLIALMVMLMRAHGQSPSELWLGHRSSAREVGLGVLLVPLVFLFVGIVMSALLHFLPGLHNVTTNPIEQLATGGPRDAAMLGVIAIVAGGIREELQRAFLLQRFEQHLGGAVVGVVVWSAAFGLLHKPQGWDAMITTGLLGAFWAVVYLRRRSSVAPIVSHAGFNSLEVLRVALIGS